MSVYTPVYSIYKRLSDGTQVGLHKFVVDQDDPPDSNSLSWEVKRLRSGLGVAGSLLAKSLAQAESQILVVSSGSTRTTAQVTITQAQLARMKTLGDSNPHELIFVTFHGKQDGNASSLTRTA